MICSNVLPSRSRNTLPFSSFFSSCRPLNMSERSLVPTLQRTLLLAVMSCVPPTLSSISSSFIWVNSFILAFSCSHFSFSSVICLNSAAFASFLLISSWITDLVFSWVESRMLLTFSSTLFFICSNYTFIFRKSFCICIMVSANPSWNLPISDWKLSTDEVKLLWRFWSFLPNSTCDKFWIGFFCLTGTYFALGAYLSTFTC